MLPLEVTLFEVTLFSGITSHQAGRGAKELCRKNEISVATFDKWRLKDGDMELSPALRLKTLESEKAKLNKMLAEQMMDMATLKKTLGKNF